MNPLRPLGIVSAIPEELAHLVDAAGDVSSLAGLKFRRGDIAGRSAVFVEAGMGKVNAALAATVLLDRFDCRALIFCGVAGGVDPSLGVGDLVIGQRNLQHDYGAMVGGNLITYQPGNPPLPGFDTAHGWEMPQPLRQRLAGALAGLTLPAIAAEAAGGIARQPQVVFATIATGDTFVNCEATRQSLARRHNAAAVEMEGGAVAQVCSRFGDVPFVNVRCLSDLAGAESHIDFRLFLPVAARLASQVVHRLAPAI